MTASASDGSSASRERAGTRAGWTPHAQRAAWLMTTLGVFLAPPPSGILTLERRQLAGLSAFIVAILTGLILLWMRRRSAAIDTRFWGVVTVACLVAGLAAFVLYESSREQWTVPYAGTRLLRGTRYTDRAQRARSDQAPTDSALVVMAAGDPTLVWQEDSFPTWRTRAELLGGYVIAVVMLSSCILAVGQAYACAARRREEPAPSS